MKVAVIGAAGKTGIKVVREALKRGLEVVAVCRETSEQRLDEFAGRDGFSVVTAQVVSDEAILTQALSGCDVVVGILISVRELKATALVSSLVKATEANGVKRLVFTAGEVTAVPDAGETYTLRQRIMRTVGLALTRLSPYSMADMLKSSALVADQTGWDWTIVRAPTLNDTPPVGYKICEISDVTGAHALSRDDYAACMLDSLDCPEHFRRKITVVAGE